MQKTAKTSTGASSSCWLFFFFHFHFCSSRLCSGRKGKNMCYLINRVSEWPASNTPLPCIAPLALMSTIFKVILNYNTFLGLHPNGWTLLRGPQFLRHSSESLKLRTGHSSYFKQQNLLHHSCLVFHTANSWSFQKQSVLTVAWELLETLQPLCIATTAPWLLCAMLQSKVSKCCFWLVSITLRHGRSHQVLPTHTAGGRHQKPHSKALLPKTEAVWSCRKAAFWENVLHPYICYGEWTGAKSNS